MGLRIWLAKKLIGKRNKTEKIDIKDFDEDEKSLNAELRKLQKENKIRDLEIQLAEKDLELAEIEEDMKELTGEDMNDASNDPLKSFEQTMVNLFSGNFKNNNSPQQTLSWETPNTTSQITQQTDSGVSHDNKKLSDEDINKLISLIPPDKLQQAKKTPDFMLKMYAKKNFPQFSDDDVNRFINKIKSQNI